jgi:hypothetical protein
MLSPIGNYLLTIWRIIATGDVFGSGNGRECVWEVGIEKDLLPYK